MQRIRPNQNEQLVIRALSVNFAERVHGIADPAALQFQIRHDKSIVAANRQLDQLRALAVGKRGSIAFVGRDRTGDKPDLIKSGLFPAVFSQNQMTVMNGIERSPKNPNSHFCFPNVRGLTQEVYPGVQQRPITILQWLGQMTQRVTECDMLRLTNVSYFRSEKL